MDGLNVCVGIDAGNYESKLAYSDGLGTRIIARLDGFDLAALREESEAYFDEPIFSCVVARDSRVRTDDSGFSDVDVITQSEAVTFGLGRAGKNVVYDLGESSCRIYVTDTGRVIDIARVDDVSGKLIDAEFADYLAERYSFSAGGYDVLHESRRIKHVLTEEEMTTLHELKIYRYELERVIHFPVKRSTRTLQRLVREHKPDRVILTGGNVKIPEVRRVISEVLGIMPEYRMNLIAEGAAIKAREHQREIARSERPDTASRLCELRAGMLELEEKLTRRQKDRVYAMFRQAEGINDAGIIALMEKMINEIRSV